MADKPPRNDATIPVSSEEAQAQLETWRLQDIEASYVRLVAALGWQGKSLEDMEALAVHVKALAGRK